jgi:hypothetical protein
MSAFVGRSDELAALAEISRAAVRGEVAAAMVVGDPGSGKSRLLAEAAARTGLSSHFRVVGFEPEPEVPLPSSLNRNLSARWLAAASAARPRRDVVRAVA